MPVTLRHLKKELKRSGCFCGTGGKGSHSKWGHPNTGAKLILSGGDGDDAKPYQVKAVADYLREIHGWKIHETTIHYENT
ncbi:MAG: type II toxin-antitoxin system HicA family toxin [Gammaproteobacteria bacterium]